MDPDTMEWVERSIRNAEKRRCISKVLGVEKTSLVEKGENYFSEICRLKMKVVLYSGEVVERSVILKALPPSETMVKFIKETKLFNIEKKVYSEVLPLMEKIRQEKETSEPLWGECYEINNSMMLIEDLSIRGYKMANRFTGLDFDHCKLVLKSLAKFHALSAVLSEAGNLLATDFPQHFLQKNPEELMKDYYKVCFENLAKWIEEDWKGDDWLPFAEKLRQKADTVVTDIFSPMTLEKSGFSVLNHGDCWVNNMLFKYDEDDNPISVRLIDFQACYYNSLGVDLQYFMSTSPSLDVFSKIDEQLEIYSHWLGVYLERFGYSGEIPRLETIRAEYKRLAFYGFVTSVIVFPLHKMPKGDAPDLDKMIDERGKSENKQVEPIKNNSEVYEKFVKAALLNARRNGLI